MAVGKMFVRPTVRRTNLNRRPYVREPLRQLVMGNIIYNSRLTNRDRQLMVGYILYDPHKESQLVMGNILYDPQKETDDL